MYIDWAEAVPGQSQQYYTSTDIPYNINHHAIYARRRKALSLFRIISIAVSGCSAVLVRDFDSCFRVEATPSLSAETTLGSVHQQTQLFRWRETGEWHASFAYFACSVVAHRLKNDV